MTTVNRTLLSQVLPTGPTLARGRVAVLDRFVHAERGEVRCPAAAALTADLGDRLGHGAAVTRGEVIEGTAEGSVTVCVTYLDRDGHAIGLAAVVRADDYEAIDMVQQTMRTWAASMRTRRVLVADLPECMTGECPHHRMAHASVLDFTDRGDAIVLIADRRLGRVAAAELAAAAQNAGGTAFAVTDPAEVSALDADPDALSFVIVPGIRVEAAMPILYALRERFPRLRGQHPDEYCYAESDLRESVRSVAEASERLLVVSASPAEASAAAEAHGVPWQQILDPALLRPAHLAASTLGLVSTSRAGAAGLRPVLDLLAGLGPLSVRHRAVRTGPPSNAVTSSTDATHIAENAEHSGDGASFPALSGEV
jgi:4-hydroxy-3-methylbut-2-en-1-yl diphosphate reductase